MAASRLAIGAFTLLAAGAIACQDEGAPEEEQPLQPPVAIAVTHIKFDHRGGDTDPSDGLNIRKSYALDLDHAGNGAGEGEWIPGIPRNEPVLWIASTTVTVTARLTAPANVTSADIEARALGPFKNLVKRNVQFVNGVSQPEYVEFTADGPTPASIKRLADRWLWKASNVVIQGAPAVPGPFDFGRSGEHTAYVVLAAPTHPWYAIDSLHPWVSALEFAVTRAGTDGKTSVPDAAKQIAVFLHGGYGLGYNSAEEGAPKYYDRTNVQNLRLTEFMTLARQHLVACEDLAAALVILGNLTGGSLKFTDRRKPNVPLSFGYIQPTVVVGNVRTNNPFHANPQYDPDPVVDANALHQDADNDGKIDRGAFSYHTFAVIGNDVFDATLGPTLGVPLNAYFGQVLDISTPAERAAAAGAQLLSYRIRMN